MIENKIEEGRIKVFDYDIFEKQEEEQSNWDDEIYNVSEYEGTVYFETKLGMEELTEMYNILLLKTSINHKVDIRLELLKENEINTYGLIFNTKDNLENLEKIMNDTAKELYKFLYPNFFQRLLNKIFEIMD